MASVPSSPVTQKMAGRWYPATPGAPVFQHYRTDQPTVNALTRTQVELYKQRSAFGSLLKEATANQDEFARTKAELVGCAKARSGH
jgi:hypothetical protein